MFSSWSCGSVSPEAKSKMKPQLVPCSFSLVLNMLVDLGRTDPTLKYSPSSPLDSFKCFSLPQMCMKVFSVSGALVHEDVSKLTQQVCTASPFPRVPECETRIVYLVRRGLGQVCGRAVGIWSPPRTPQFSFCRCREHQVRSVAACWAQSVKHVLPCVSVWFPEGPAQSDLGLDRPLNPTRLHGSTKTMFIPVRVQSWRTAGS